jgi:hypothetical protein
MSFIWREIFSLQTEKSFALPLQICVSLKFAGQNFKQPQTTKLFILCVLVLCTQVNMMFVMLL